MLIMVRGHYYPHGRRDVAWFGVTPSMLLTYARSSLESDLVFLSIGSNTFNGGGTWF